MDNTYFDLLPIELVTIILYYVDDLLSILPLNYKMINQILSTKEFLSGKLDIKLKRDSFIYNSLTDDPFTNINIYNHVNKLYIKLIRGMIMSPEENLTYDNFSKLNIDQKIRDSLIKIFSNSHRLSSVIYFSETVCVIYIQGLGDLYLLIDFIEGLDFMFNLLTHVK